MKRVEQNKECEICRDRAKDQKVDSISDKNDNDYDYEFAQSYL